MDEIVNHTILNRAAQFRGWVLNGTVVLERLVDVYLSRHFCYHKEEQEEIMELVFAASSGMPFDPKKNLFQIILKKHHRSFYDENTELIHDIAYIIKQRNILAHYLLDRTDAALDRFLKSGEVGFIKFKEVTETIYFTENDIAKITQKIERCIQIVNGLLPSKEQFENTPSRNKPPTS